MLQDMVSDYEASFAKLSDYTKSHSAVRGEPRHIAKARALLAKVKGE